MSWKLTNTPPKDANRYRRYGNGIILPWRIDDSPEWLPTHLDENSRHLSGYDQGSNNPEHDSTRYFCALTNSVKDTSFLKSLVMHDFKQTFWPTRYTRFPIYFGVHFVKLLADAPNKFGISSPNCFHQDGEPFTFAHLVSRSENTRGGVNYVAKPEARNKTLDFVNGNEIHQEFELGSFLQSFAVHDPAVSHYVTPIQMNNENGSKAERCIILIDFSPMIQKI